MSLNDKFNAPKKPLRGELISAAQMGDEEAVQALLKSGANINERNPESPDDGTPLTCAVSANHLEIVKLLIDKGADLEKRDGMGDTALIMATRSSHTEIVQMLVDKGANLNARNNEGDTALIEAARCNCIEEARILVDRGADIFIKNKEGKDAMALAVENGDLQEAENPEIVQILTQVLELRQRQAEEKAAAEAAAQAKRLHAIAVDRQQQLKDRAQKFKPSLGSGFSSKK